MVSDTSGPVVGSSTPLSLTPVMSNQATALLNRNDGKTNDNGGGIKKPQKPLGTLRVSVLSVYDLPSSEVPALLKGGMTLKLVHADKTFEETYHTGPPTAKHKDQAAYKLPSKELEIAIPLEDLFSATLQLHVASENNAAPAFQATYKINQLIIDEASWLILPLQEPGENGKTSQAIVTSSSRPEGGSSASSSDASAFEGQPTVRIKLQLQGPYRAEIAALIYWSQRWFALVDYLDAQLQRVWRLLCQIPYVQYIWLPAVPLLSLAVVTSPIAVGIFVIGMPLFVPLLTILGFGVACLWGFGSFLWLSTASGRKTARSMIYPMWHVYIKSTPSGQAFLYPVGPRPSPVEVLREVLMPMSPWMKLSLSLTLDLLGSTSYLIPLVGEATDIVWAPVQTIFIMALYEDVNANLKYLSFAEEILPFTDVVPTATIGWAMEHGQTLWNNHPQQQQQQNHDKSSPTMAAIATTLTNSTGTTQS